MMARLSFFTRRVRVSPRSATASTLTCKELTSRSRLRFVYSMRARRAMYVSYESMETCSIGAGEVWLEYTSMLNLKCLRNFFIFYYVSNNKKKLSSFMEFRHIRRYKHKYVIRFHITRSSQIVYGPVSTTIRNHIFQINILVKKLFTCVDAQPPSFSRWELSHITIGSLLSWR